MINRKIKNSIISRLKQFPAVALLGPRQAGKSTLAKTFPSAYYDLEIDQERLRLDLQWNEIIKSEKLIILEEVKQIGLDNLWLMGGFPDGGIIKEDMFPLWQKNYLDLIAMRDLPHWGLAAAPQVTQKFFKMTAAIQGNLWNARHIV